MGLSMLGLAGVLSLTLACQPETAETPVAETRAAALSGEVGTWTPASTPALPYSGASAVALLKTGEIVDATVGPVQRYNPYTNTWRVTRTLCEPGLCRVVAYQPLPSGKVLTHVLYAGRMGGSPGLRLYDPDADTWLTVAHQHFTGRSMTLLDSGKVLLAGGGTYQGSQWVTLNGAEVYDPASDTWSTVQGMTTPRSGHVAVRLYSGQVLVAGGSALDASGLATAEFFQPSTGSWAAIPSLPQVRTPSHAVRLYSGSVLVVGGSAPGTASTPVDVYDPYNARWTPGPALPFTEPTSLTLLYSGEVLAVNDAGQAAVYAPSQNTWLPAAPAAPASGRRPAVLLHTGQVLRLTGSPGAERFSR